MQKIDKTLKYGDNPRQITAAQFATLKKHLEQLGDLSGIIYCRKNKAYTGGNMRAQVMDGCEVEIVEEFKRPTKQKTVARGFVHWQGEKFAYREVAFTEKEFKQACIVANANGGTWDWDVLSSGAWQDEPLIEWGLDLPEDWLEQKGGVEEDESAVAGMVDRAEELQKRWKVKRGQVWQIGRHRLMCGDSTSAEDVGVLMGGEKAALCFTSPPYDQQRDYESSIKDWLGLMKGVFSSLPIEDGGQVLVNLGLIHRDGEWVPYWEPWIEWMRGQGWRRFGWYVWDQGSGLPGDWNGRLAPAFEFVWHFNRESLRPLKTVAKNPNSGPMGSNLRSRDGKNATPSSVCRDPNKIMDSVIRVNRNSAHGTGHPATFPVDLPAKILEAWPGDVYEPFGGAGTTMVAAEKTAHRAFVSEIEPKYCAVTLERMSALGLSPQLVK